MSICNDFSACARQPCGRVFAQPHLYKMHHMQDRYQQPHEEVGVLVGKQRPTAQCHKVHMCSSPSCYQAACVIATSLHFTSISSSLCSTSSRLLGLPTCAAGTSTEQHHSKQVLHIQRTSVGHSYIGRGCMQHKAARARLGEHRLAWGLAAGCACAHTWARPSLFWLTRGSPRP